VKYVLLAMLGMVLLISAAEAGDLKLGVGATGGINVPIVQDDQKAGSIFEFRGRLQAVSMVVVEPKLFFSSYGSPETFEDIVWDVDGSKIVAYGIDALVGGGMGSQGFKPFIVAGVGLYSISNDDTKSFMASQTKFGWSAGLGFGIGVTPAIDIDVRSKVHIITFEGSSSKKSVSVGGGLNYYFGGE
jgi:opacity protein-like surface antigen